MGFWKEVDIEIRNRMQTYGTSYNDEINESVKQVAKEKYGKKVEGKVV